MDKTKMKTKITKKENGTKEEKVLLCKIKKKEMRQCCRCNFYFQGLTGPKKVDSCTIIIKVGNY